MVKPQIPHIYRVSLYTHHERDDNVAIVAAIDPSETLSLLEKQIKRLSEKLPFLRNNFKFNGRIDEIGAKAEKEGIIFMSYPFEHADITQFPKIQEFHDAYLTKTVQVFSGARF